MQKGEQDRASGADNIPEDAVVRGQAEWGRGGRGAEGYSDAGQSELNFTLQEADEYQKQKAERDKEEKGNS